jgi:hypothetical protein
VFWRYKTDATEQVLMDSLKNGGFRNNFYPIKSLYKQRPSCGQCCFLRVPEILKHAAWRTKYAIILINVLAEFFVMFRKLDLEQ